MSRPPHIVLVGNYLPDGGESMDRYARILAAALPEQGFKVTLVLPPVVLGRLAGRSAALAKLFGYVDKLVLFPGHLRRRLQAAAPVDLVHLCDNCSGYCTPAIKRVRPPPPVLVTCHDFFAVNGSLGFAPGLRPRFTGRLLQRYFLRGVRLADHHLCVSASTAENLRRLHTQAHPSVVPNGVAEEFRALPAATADRITAGLHPALAARPRGYVFHLGNNHWYKNRVRLLEAYFEACRSLPAPPALVLAGKKPDAELEALMVRCPPAAEIVALGRVTEQQLAALYSNAGCMLFPSLAEGFGWPILEAMACGCPVITSDRAPMNEIGRPSALLVDPTNVREMAAAIIRILRLSPDERARLGHAGQEQAATYSIARMVQGVARRYREILPHRGGSPSTRAGADTIPASIGSC